MKYCAILAFDLLLVVVSAPALAQDNEAEKLFRNMEKRILAAKSVEVRFDYQIENREGEKWKWKTKGTLLLTKDSSAQLKVSGYFADERDAPFQLVSDGKRLKTTGVKFVVASNGVPGVEQGGQSEHKTPKNFHAALGALVSRAGVWYSLFVMPYLLREGIDPDAEGSRVNAYDFKFGAADKVGERDAKVVRYRFGDGGNDGPEVTLWVDGKTLLPLRRVFDLRKNRGVVSGIMITESYNGVTLDPKIDVKAFELPK
jgi:outer membrane lipoprotein-sorting protein